MIFALQRILKNMMLKAENKNEKCDDVILKR